MSWLITILLVIILINIYFIRDEISSIEYNVGKNERELRYAEDSIKKLSRPDFDFNPNVYDLDSTIVTFGELIIPSKCLYSVPDLDKLMVKENGSVELKFIFRYDEDVYKNLYNHQFTSKSKSCKLHIDKLKVGYWGSIKLVKIIDTAHAGKLMMVIVELNSAFYEEEK